MDNFSEQDWAYAYGTPQATGVFKHCVEDFVVKEDLGFELSDSGEHVCVKIRKKGVGTAHIVKTLAQHLSVKERDIGYAGLKDRQGICEQWFSLYVGKNRDVDLTPILGEQIELLDTKRNERKIRRGSHKGNIFEIRLRNVHGSREALEERLQAIAREGVPNYFGEQRFGFGNSNIEQALKLFRGELRLRPGFKRGMLLSAARSFLFNEILSARVQGNTWNQYLDGDVLNLQGSHSVFVPEQWDETLQQRLLEHDIHPTGALWGKGKYKASADCAALEQALVEQYAELRDGLLKFGLEHDRRSLRLLIDNLQWQLTETELLLQFSLPSGAYATTVLREVLALN
ncbi:MAG: tRNA pseudouridine(13) synthase TruD [Pseudohongiellaceae bacterium]|nr:tRNA pseudouridine(13) synthase TruD [Pseudohongiellaceae bacterium]